MARPLSKSAMNHDTLSHLFSIFCVQITCGKMSHAKQNTKIIEQNEFTNYNLPNILNKNHCQYVQYDIFIGWLL